MSLLNGVLSPPPISDPATSINLSTKRKREEKVPYLESTILPELSLEESQALITDLIDVLKARNDLAPSILAQPIPNLPLSDEPHSKRLKPEEIPESKTCISSRLSSNLYKSVDEVLEDIDAAVHDMIDNLESPNGFAKNQYTLMTRPLSELSLKLIAFSRRAHELVKKEKDTRERRLTHKKNYLSHSYLNSGSELFSHASTSNPANRLVLTLLGNAPAPKQLFSSLQLPTKITGNNEVIAPIREAGLPNGITASRVIPTHNVSVSDNKKPVHSLGEVFFAQTNLTPLVPPNPSKKATTKSLNVGWYYPTPSDSVLKTSSYFNQGVTSGIWVQYGNNLTVDKEKNRKCDDTVASLPGNLICNDSLGKKPETTECGASDLEILFKSAYSSFAPTRDDATAIVPSGTLDRLWWDEIGKFCFNRYIENGDMYNSNISSDSISQEKIDSGINIFEEGLKELEKDAIDPSLISLESEPEKPVTDKDVEEILAGISELLETLKSYQRNRHISLNTTGRSASLLLSPDARNLGSPPRPSESEQATYEILKSQLTMMVSTLPPYAVAKLSPERLAELSISTKIEVRLNDYKGVMDEDESASRAKIATSVGASSSRASNQPMHRSSGGSNVSNSHYGNQFTMSQPRSTMAQFYSPSQTPIRSSSASTQRPSNVTPIPYQAQRTSSAGPYRPSTYGMSSYPHQSPRPAQQPYVSMAQQAPYPQNASNQSYLLMLNQGRHGRPTR